MWNLVCLKLCSKGKFLSLPTIHNFEMIEDRFLDFFRTWGKLRHSTTNTNCYFRAVSLSYKSVIWIPCGGHILNYLYFLAVSLLLSLTRFSFCKYIWYWQMEITEQNLYAPITYRQRQYILGSLVYQKKKKKVYSLLQENHICSFPISKTLNT